MDVTTVVLYAASLLGLYALGYFALVPLKWAGRLILNALLGGVCLFLLNLLGAGIGIDIGINPVTALTAGILGVPGVALLVIVSAVL